MKNFDLPLKCEEFKYITVVYLPQLESVKLMVQEHYDTPDYEDTLFFINTIYFFDETMELIKEKDFKQHRRIYYNFEHAGDSNADEVVISKYRFEKFGITEVWTFEPNNETFDTDLGVKYMPVRFTEYITKAYYDKPKKFDLGFVGIVGSNGYSPRRNNLFNDYILNSECDFSMKIMNGYQIMDLKDDFLDCRFAFDSKRNYRHNMQNQVRIFEHICMGHTVLSEKSDYNIFPGLIYEWETIDDLNNLIHTVEPQDFREQYKEMTYSDEAYEEYRNAILIECYNNYAEEYFDCCGLKKYDIINRLIKTFNYKSYLEIGVKLGEVLKLINCEHKVGVDPVPNEYVTHVMTSDEYFAQLPEDVKFDIILVDGMHLWEYCYRDINNALNHLSPNGIIICHDMNPYYEMYNSRVNYTELWNGDVWRAFVKMRTERSDVFSCMIEDCDYGLGIICFGEQEPLKLDKPFDELLYADFAKDKKYLMNTVKVKDFIERNRL